MKKRITTTTPDLHLKRVFTIPEACEYLGIGVTTAYELMAEGELRSFTIGRSRRVTRDACDEFIFAREDVG